MKAMPGKAYLCNMKNTIGVLSSLKSGLGKQNVNPCGGGCPPALHGLTPHFCLRAVKVSHTQIH